MTHTPTPESAEAALQAVDAIDRALIVATQGGLPLVVRPYHAIAAELKLPPDDVMARLRRLQTVGIIRRVGVVPNHYAIGYRANGMSVWDVADARIDELGAVVGQLDFVTHCYRRPRRLPMWPYNLFAMVHGGDRTEVAVKVAQIAALLGDASAGHDVLYSTRIIKKTGLRLTD